MTFECCPERDSDRTDEAVLFELIDALNEYESATLAFGDVSEVSSFGDSTTASHLVSAATYVNVVMIVPPLEQLATSMNSM